MNRIDPDMGELVSQAVRDIGVELHLEEKVEAIEGDRVRAVRTAARTLEADLVVLGLGTQPAVGLAEASGIQLGPSGAIAVNPACAPPTRGVGGRRLRRVPPPRVRQAGQLPPGDDRQQAGRVCGINIGGGYATFRACSARPCPRCARSRSPAPACPRPSWASSAWNGSGRRSTRPPGRLPPGAAPIRIKVLAERRSGRLLGAQIVGKEGAAKRIDVFATAIWNGMAVDEMVNLDLSYAPPFSPVWDPVLIAVRKAPSRSTGPCGSCEPRPQQAPAAPRCSAVSIGTPVRAV